MAFARGFCGTGCRLGADEVAVTTKKLSVRSIQSTKDLDGSETCDGY